MKVLTAFDTGPNQYLDVIYRGLVSEGMSVTDLNYSPMHNSNIEESRIVLKNKEGEKIAEEGIDGMIHFSKPINGLSKCHKWLCSDGRKYEFNPHALENLDDYDAVLVGAFPANNDNRRYMEILLERADDRFRFLDGGDDWYIKKSNSRFKVYFKRELMHRRIPNLKEFVARRLGDRRGGNAKEIISFWRREVIGEMLASDPKKTIANVRGKLYKKDEKFQPLNLSVASHNFNKIDLERQYDIFFVTSSGSASRRYFADKISQFSKDLGLEAFVKVTGSFYGGVPWKEYIEKMQSSKLAISYPGNGFDTIRYWEIPYYGTALVSPRLPLVIENDFVDMESAVFFSDFSEFKRKVVKILKEGLWNEIARKGHDRFVKFHTEKERANRVLNTF